MDPRVSGFLWVTDCGLWLLCFKCLLNGSMNEQTNEWTNQWSPSFLPTPHSPNNSHGKTDPDRPVLPHKPIHLSKQQYGEYVKISSATFIAYLHISFRSLFKSHLTYLSKWNENLHAHRHLYMNVCSGFICDCQKPEVIQMSFNWRMNGLWYIHTRKYHSSIKRNKLLIYTTWMNLNDSFFSSAKRSQTQRLCTV